MSSSTRSEPAHTYENPLLPNARLLQLHRQMLEARWLIQHARSSAGKNQLLLGRCAGEEAARVGSAIHLQPGDFISDEAAGLPLSAWLRNAALPSSEPKAASKKLTQLLPAADPVELRLSIALGVAEGLKRSAGRIVLCYVAAGESGKSLWRRALPYAAAQELPIVFLILPPPLTVLKASQATVHLGDGFGVPAITTDCDDLIGIYRVAQESAGRARAGGGPAVIGCIPYLLDGQKMVERADALGVMEMAMRAKGLHDDGLARNVHLNLTKQIARTKSPEDGEGSGVQPVK